MQWRHVCSDVMHRATRLPFLPRTGTGTHHHATVTLSWPKSGMNNQTSPKRNPSFIARVNEVSTARVRLRNAQTRQLSGLWAERAAELVVSATAGWDLRARSESSPRAVRAAARGWPSSPCSAARLGPARPAGPGHPTGQRGLVDPPAAVILASGPSVRNCAPNGPSDWKPQKGWCSSTPWAARASHGPWRRTRQCR